MRLILALLLCFTLPAVAQMPGLNPGRDPRLPVPVAHPPWHAVALLEAEGIGICTGAMLAPAVLLTAAHCLKDAAGTSLLPPTQIRVTLGGAEGMVKVVGDEETDLLLGVFIVGPQAGELIAEAALALEMGATLTDLALTVHPHPTLSESLMEAAEAFHKQAIHILNR